MKQSQSQLAVLAVLAGVGLYLYILSPRCGVKTYTTMSGFEQTFLFLYVLQC